MNLNESDVVFFENRFGYGWTVEVRRIMHREVLNYKMRDDLQDLDVGNHQDIFP